MDHKDFKLYIKALGDDGTFEGKAAVFGNVDRDGDVIERRAFNRTVKNRGGEPIPVLWQHQTDMPVGAGHLSIDEVGLNIKGQFLLTTRAGRDAYEYAKAGVVKGLSIGYRSVADTYEAGRRVLKEIELYEVSLATIPANPLAQLTAVKSCEGCPNHRTPAGDECEQSDEKALPQAPAIKASDSDLHSLAVVMDALAVSAIALKEL